MTTRIFVVLAALLLPAAGLADSREDEPLEADACPRVFGDEDTARKNRARRERLLYGARRVGRTVELDFRGAWKHPRLFLYDEIEVLETGLDEDGQSYAVVHVEGLEHLGCPEGDYVVRVDDALGAGTRVLAIVEPDLVLLEADGTLGYILPDDASPPLWRLSWDSGIRFRQRARIETTTAKGRKRRRRRRRKRRRRRRRRRR